MFLNYVVFRSESQGNDILSIDSIKQKGTLRGLSIHHSIELQV